MNFLFKPRRPYSITICMVLLFMMASAAGQSIYEEMSLDELLKVDVVETASKVPEDLFETPLSVTIIQQEEIQRSGAVSIMEALRLSPGLIVREVTPGNWDIHIRGFEDITKNAYVSLPFNTTTLVMVDNRIVFSYFTGGTFWETLPIGIHDVKRIEIVRGPASALYGSNAVTGVINIITTDAYQDNGKTHIHSSLGENAAFSLRASRSFQWKDFGQLRLSANINHRQRSSSEYYDWWSEEYGPLDSLDMFMGVLKNSDSKEYWTYPEYRDSLGADYDPSLSLEQQSVNLKYYKMFNHERDMEIASGVHTAASQLPGFLNFTTPLSIHRSWSRYVAVKLKHDGIHAQATYYKGEYMSNYRFNSHTNENLEFQLEYHQEFKKTLIRPGVTYRHFNYNSPLTYSEPFDLSLLNDDFRHESHHLHVASAYVLSEYRPTPKLRVIGGFRLDQFDVNENLSLNHELATTYRLDKNNLFRVVKSRATRSPFIFDTYLNAKLNIGDYLQFPTNEAPLFLEIAQSIEARREQKYLTNDTYEISLRSKINPRLEVDIELFKSHMSNVQVSNEYRQQQFVIQLDEQGQGDSLASVSGSAQMYFENFDFHSDQIGVSTSLSGRLNSQIDFRLFGTFQSTSQGGIVDQDFYSLGQSVFLDTSNQTLVRTLYSYTNPTQWSPELTPTFYGGLYLNYQCSAKTNLNMNMYYTSRQIFGGLPFYNVTADVTGKYYYNYVTVPAYANINLKLSHRLDAGFTLFLSIRNLMGTHTEFAFSDPIHMSYQAGIQW